MDAQAGIGRQYVDRSERFLHRLDQRLGSVRFTEVCRERRGFPARRGDRGDNSLGPVAVGPVVHGDARARLRQA